MSRTVHAFNRHHHRGFDGEELPWSYVAHAGRAYRRSEERHAALEGRRPQPFYVRRRVLVWIQPRGFNDRSIAELANWYERQIRAEVRVRLRRAVQAVNADPDAVEDVDVPSPQHRRSALWDAW